VKRNRGSSYLTLLIGVLVLSATMLLVVLGLSRVSDRVSERQIAFLEQSVQRSAISCYVIEGRFPTTEEGVAYLREHYGLQIDETRYIVHYESIADNMLPLVRVVAITSTSPLDEINETLGLSPVEIAPLDSTIEDTEP